MYLPAMYGRANNYRKDSSKVREQNKLQKEKEIKKAKKKNKSAKGSNKANLTFLVTFVILSASFGLCVVFYALTSSDTNTSSHEDIDIDIDIGDEEDGSGDTGTWNNDSNEEIHYSYSINSTLLIIENSTPDRGWSNYLYAQAFNIINQSQMNSFSAMFEFNMISENHSEKNVTFQIRDRLITTDPNIDNTGLIYASQFGLNVSYEEEWITVFVPQLELSVGDYWLYIDLFDMDMSKQYAWMASYDINSGNNASPYLWQRNFQEWYNIDSVFTGDESDLLMTVNLSYAI